MTISDILKKSGYAVLFGFLGLITGIWTASLLYRLILNNAERTITSGISLIIILVIVIAALALGFIKGKELMED